jgi:alpha-1,2-mannosyltransferase
MIRAAQRVLTSSYFLPLVTLAVIGVVFVDPLRRSDLMVFLRAAHDVSHGVNPYTPTSDAFLWGGSAYVYPYLTAFLFIPFTWVPVAVADVVWFALCGGGLLYGCRMLGLRDPVAISALLLSATSIRSFQVGGINALLFLAAAAAWRYRAGTKRFALAFTFLAGSKLFLLPVAVWVVLTRSWRTVVVAGGSLVTFLGLSLLLQPISTAQFLESMQLLAEHEGSHGMAFAHLLDAVLSPSTARLLALLLAGALLAGAAAYRFRRGESADVVVFGVSIVAAMVATPVYWSHYTVLFAAVVLVAWPTRRAAVLFALGSWLVSRPEVAPSMLQLPMTLRIALLHVTMVAVVLAVGVTRRSEPVEEPLTPPIMEELLSR